MSILTKIDLFLNYKLYGMDEFGNNYFIAKKIDPVLKKQKRMIQYNGLSEASKVPPGWHAWLHYIVDEVGEDMKNTYDWQKNHQPNVTGTKSAYMPRWHVSKEKTTEETQDKIVAWVPKQ